MAISKITKISEKLSELKRKQEEADAERRAAKNKLPYMNLSVFPINSEVLYTLSEKDARQGNLVVLKNQSDKITVGLISPDDAKTKEIIEKLTAKFACAVSQIIISRSSLERAFKFYQIKVSDVPLIGKISIGQKYLDDFNQRVKDISALKEHITKLSTTEILETIIAGSLKTGAGDIHIEPGKEIRLRYRIDGVLQDVASFSLKIYQSMLTRIKLLSDMMINIHDTAQDGRFTIQITEPSGENEKRIKQEMETRVSVLPEGNAETVVIRILGAGVEKLQVEGLGLREHALDTLLREVKKPNGLVLNTGPTGSGKTTTLYSLLNYLNDPKIKIITIEDPVEYRLPGIVQTQISKNYSFAQALRAILRQNPNVVMVGEIRDDETAKIAMQAAMTGHLVFSTLHTNDAVSTVHRIIDMGVDLKTLPDALNTIIAQRLVRCLCPKCKEEYEPDKQTALKIEKVLSIISPRAKVEIPKTRKLWRAKGCPDCFGLKYKGRLPLFEMLNMNEEIRKLILNRSSAFEILVSAVDSGMLTLYQDGVLRSLEGSTDLAEVERVAGLPGYLDELYERAASQALTRGIAITKENKEKFEKTSKERKEIEKILASSPQEEMLNNIINFSLLLRATDIHIEPTQSDLMVRCRVDGILQDIARVPRIYHLPLLGEIKILAGLKTKEFKGVQEGRFNIDFAGESLDVRLSIIAGGYGETAVIRILGLSKDVQSKEGGLDLKMMGIRQEIYPLLEKEIGKPTGVILTTGPTGSGKTTTLYGILQKLNGPGVKIMTIEDPIEYRLSGIIQTQIDVASGYTFAAALRSFLRQNPNIIMVGEIRDEETAKIAIQASLTGHLVISTLHTNDAASTVQRLINLGISAGDIASAANAIMAQRLVRKLCPDCKKAYKPEVKLADEIKKVLAALPKNIKAPDLSKITLYKPSGCAKCKNFGYWGQVALYEIMIKDEVLQAIMAKGASTLEIKKAAQAGGMITLRQDGLLKALDGLTSIEEIERVTGELEKTEL
jgi:type II secretory ATPase GspE/PulE/Tfp pilus assembly ATPase PilB-like protein